MPSDKRQRKREGRQARIAAERAAARRRRTRNRVIAAVLAGAVILALLAAFAGRGGGGTTPTSAGASTTTTARASAPRYGTTPCPPADGSGPKRATFDAPFQKCIDPAKTYTATIETDLGAVTVRLLPDKAPLTVNNFVALARSHAYDDVPFHRVIPGFVVQGGDVEKKGGTGGPGYSIVDELPRPGDYREGSLAMANSGPNTNGSQFFIVVSPEGAKTLVQAVGGTANYTLFGQVTGGMDVVKKIEADGSAEGTPKTVHTITKVTITES